MVESLGPYKILDRIGVGGLGEVYRARDTNRGRTVAIKVLPADFANDAAARERFVRDAQAGVALSHPNIAALYEIGEHDGLRYLAFEFVPGESLRQIIAGRPLNPRRAIDLAAQIADALAEAHAAGIVHRDIKPDNVIVTPKGNAKILDFGLAAWTGGGADREHASAAPSETPSPPSVATVAYLSPEQALGEPVDERTDLFSLGAVLFEMLTGTAPFFAATAAAIAGKIVQSPAPAPSSVNRSLPRELDEIVGRLLARRPSERYESAATVAAELRAVGAILDERSAAAAASSPVVVRPPQRQPSAGRWIVLALAAAGLAALAWLAARGL